MGPLDKPEKKKRRGRSPSAERARRDINPGRFADESEQATYDFALARGVPAAQARAEIIASRGYAQGARVRFDVEEEQDAHDQSRRHHPSPSVANAHSSRPPNARIKTESRGLPGVSEGISSSEPNEAYDSSQGVRRSHHSKAPRIVHPGSLADIQRIQAELDEKTSEAMPDLERDPEYDTLQARFAALQQGLDRTDVAIRQTAQDLGRKKKTCSY